MTGRSRRAIALAALGLLLALAVAFAIAALHRPEQASVRLDGQPIEAHVTLSPLDPQFADTVVATIDVFVDSSRLDPQNVQVDARFDPYSVAAGTRTLRREGSVSIVHVEDRLVCLEAACATAGRRTFTFAPARIAYRQGADVRHLTAEWPALRVHTRVTSAEVSQPLLRLSPPQAADARYRLPPRATGIVVLVLAGALALLGGALLLRAVLQGYRVRRRPGTVLDGILRELTAASANGDTSRRRRALEELARELEPLDEPLSLESRVLAWAPREPGPEEITELTTRVVSAVRG